MASIIKVETLQDTDGNNAVDMQYVANGSTKYWLHLNGTGTIAIRGSLNTSTVTDNGNGDYIGNFTNSFNSTDNMSAPRGSSFSNASTTAIAQTWSYEAATSSLRHVTLTSSGTFTDTANNTHSCLGDLA